MNPRQRRGALLMIVACVGAVGVFVAMLSYVNSVNARVGDYTTILKLTKDVAANASVTSSAFEEEQVPKKWVGKNYISDPDSLQGKVAARNLKKDSFLYDGMVMTAPRLQSGQREIAILIDAETGVAGKVQPNSVVDIYATYQTGNQGEKSCAVRVLANARVVDVGQQRSQRQSNDDGQVDVEAVVPVTFALSPTDSLTLTYAESFAQKLRLALVGPGSTEIPEEDRVCDTVTGGTANE